MHNTKPVVTSRENRVYVNFYSDLSYSGRGFSASYKSIPASEWKLNFLYNFRRVYD